MTTIFRPNYPLPSPLRVSTNPGEKPGGKFYFRAGGGENFVSFVRSCLLAEVFDTE